jgi:hypothetical protein
VEVVAEDRRWRAPTTIAAVCSTGTLRPCLGYSVPWKDQKERKNEDGYDVAYGALKTIAESTKAVIDVSRT